MSFLRKVGNGFKTFFIALMEARAEAAIQRAKHNLYYWD